LKGTYWGGCKSNINSVKEKVTGTDEKPPNNNRKHLEHMFRRIYEAVVQPIMIYNKRSERQKVDGARASQGPK